MGMWGFILRLTGYIVQQTNTTLLIAILAVLIIDGKPVVSVLVFGLKLTFPGWGYPPSQMGG